MKLVNQNIYIPFFYSAFLAALISYTVSQKAEIVPIFFVKRLLMTLK